MSNSNELHKLLKDTKKDDLIKLSRQTCEHGHSLITHPKCMQRFLGKEDRIGILDIETTDLKADYGFMFCYCIKNLGGDIITNSIKPKELKDMSFDKRLIQEFCKDIRKFDKVVTYYGSLFDLPFLRTRAFYYMQRGIPVDFPVFQEVKQYDLYFTAKSKLKLRNRRLQTICEHLNIQAKEHPLTPDVWFKARSGDQKALDYIVTHCQEDVRSTEEVYKLFHPLVGPKNNSI